MSSMEQDPDPNDVGSPLSVSEQYDMEVSHHGYQCSSPSSAFTSGFNPSIHGVRDECGGSPNPEVTWPVPAPVISPYVTDWYPYQYPATWSEAYLPHGTSGNSFACTGPSPNFPQYESQAYGQYWYQNSPGAGYNAALPAPAYSSLSPAPTVTDQQPSYVDAYDRHSYGKSRKMKTERCKQLARDRRDILLTHSYRRHPKPPYSYCGLVVTVIEDSPQQKLTLSQIIDRLHSLFEVFRGPYQGWRDSVRHTLTHKACFRKEEVCPSLKQPRCHLWAVVLDKVPPGAFCLQRAGDGKPQRHKDHVHEELGLPAVQLPHVTPGLDCRCRNPTPLRLPVTVKKLLDAKRRASPSPLVGQPAVTQLQLPTARDCSLATASPEVYRARDLNTSGLTPIRDCSLATAFPEVYRARNLNTSGLTPTRDCSLTAALDYSIPTTSQVDVFRAIDLFNPSSLTNSLPTATDCSLPTATDCSLPTATDCSLPTATDCSLPTATDCSLPTALDCSLPCASDCSLPIASDCSLPSATDCSQPTALDCSLHTASPEVNRARDLPNPCTLTPSLKSKLHIHEDTPVKDEDTRQTATPSPCDPDSQFVSLSKYIMSTAEDVKMTDAVENLSFLCEDRSSSQ